MNQAILIRTNVIDESAISLKNHLEKFFGLAVFFATERYSDEHLDIQASGNTIEIGRKFLQKNGLKYFKRCGWQCGDYIYYGALSAIGDDYDYLWMIEPDVYLTMDPNDFFQKFSEFEHDLIGIAFGERKENWSWYPSINRFNPSYKVCGMYFPLSRLSVAAIKYCQQKRREYSESEYVSTLNFGVQGMIQEYANDESFVASTLANGGFSCIAMHKLLNDELKDGFSTENPILPEETSLPVSQGKVLHPVCDEQRARNKFSIMYNKYPAAVIKKRMDEIVSNFGHDVWLRYSGIHPHEIERKFESESAE